MRIISLTALTLAPTQQFFDFLFKHALNERLCPCPD
jgi:hypothetical protein